MQQKLGHVQPSRFKESSKWQQNLPEVSQFGYPPAQSSKLQSSEPLYVSLPLSKPQPVDIPLSEQPPPAQQSVTRLNNSSSKYFKASEVHEQIEPWKQTKNFANNLWKDYKTLSLQDKQSRLEAILAVYNNFLMQNGNHSEVPVALYNKGYTLFELEKYREALTIFVQGLKIWISKDNTLDNTFYTATKTFCGITRTFYGIAGMLRKLALNRQNLPEQFNRLTELAAKCEQLAGKIERIKETGNTNNTNIGQEARTILTDLKSLENLESNADQQQVQRERVVKSRRLPLCLIKPSEAYRDIKELIEKIEKITTVQQVQTQQINSLIAQNKQQMQIIQSQMHRQTHQI